tara:strand:- start:1198 stop:2250 length:1053 start_codon:yes stop_codon:yes gene_type:complete
MKILKKEIGVLKNRKIYSLNFTNNNDYSVSFFNIGGYIHQVFIPYLNDQSTREDVILGYKNLHDCQISKEYFNKIIGRIAGRISDSKFFLKGKEYKLYKNSSSDHLHGGYEGFDKKIWKIDNILEEKDILKCTMKYFSPHLEENYPGNLECNVTYSLNNQNEFSIYFEGESDQDTIVNMTNHNYWNFHGHKNYYQNITNHNVLIKAEKVCEINENYIPTGNIISVVKTKFDLNKFYNISQDFLNKGGIDHNYVLENYNLAKPNGIIFSNLTGMGVEYFTDQPGMQFYTGNMMNKSMEGKYNKIYKKHFGICFEPQLFPDAINHPNFISPILKKGEKYTSTIKMRLRNDFK